MRAGRKAYQIDWEVVDKYLRGHCDGKSIARLMGIHYETLYDAVKREKKTDFSEYARQKREEGVALVEYSIYIDALKKGGADRMFWLKNKAGWKDRTETDLNIKEIPQLPNIIIK